MSQLVLRNVSRTFGGFTAVDGLNMTLREGELVSLLGPSGCGKTTTLRMIAGFIAPTAGTIEVNGQVISSPGSSLPPEKRKMSMIFQSYAIWPNMTVQENVAFGLKLQKLPAPEVKRRVDQILDVVRLRALADRFPSELSGGQQQRVALARPSSSIPRSCCWTNPCPTSTRTCARRCASRSGGCTTSSE
ncbi:ABC transporter ATP-binding protein [Ramlibacter sp. MMS24-I3-19]|uniref:ABC transporter ATP-binding protein n=1 Tax=Ramlibacter sp. MMS24-I3-19 TaxID=3416606 RepID=UPI003D0064A8